MEGAPGKKVMRSETQKKTAVAAYTCPMHPEVRAAKPGKCPKCEMDLVPTDTVAHGKIAEANWRKQHPAGAQPAPARQH